MDGNSTLGQQQLRPEWERKLPEYALAQLDHERARKAMNPDNRDLMERLAIIEAKLDRILEIDMGRSRNGTGL